MKKTLCTFALIAIYGVAFTQPEAKLEKIVQKTLKKKDVFGVNVCLSNSDQSKTWQHSTGNFTSDTPFFIASTTKLFTTAIVMQLRQEGLLQLDDPIAQYLPDSIINGLHLLDGVDYSRQITIRHLLSQTSGLPDYFQQKRPDGGSLERDLTAGRDQSWSPAAAIAMSKRMPAKFAPGASGKAHYSDTNYQLLGLIIERVTGLGYDLNCERRIFQPLGLVHTYVYRDTQDRRPKPLYYRQNELWAPRAMSSFGPDGGVVSTAGELMVFLRAFYEGRLFPKAYLTQMQDWNPIFKPLEYGVGMSRFRLPAIYRTPEMIGHSGLSGAFAFYVPSKDLYMTGTVNQIHHPGRSFQMMVRLAQAW